MYDEPEKLEPPPPPCAACGDPALNGFWDTWLCDGCNAAWSREAPMLEPLELAHAEAHPQDVEERGGHQWVDSKPWVILKPGVAARVARAAALGWLKLRQKARAA